MVTYYNPKAFPGLQRPLLGLHPLVLDQDPLGGSGLKAGFSPHREVKDKHPSESVSHVQLLDLMAYLTSKSTHYSLGCGCPTRQVPETQLQSFPPILPTICLLCSVIGGSASCRPLPQPTPASQNSVTRGQSTIGAHPTLHSSWSGPQGTPDTSLETAVPSMLIAQASPDTCSHIFPTWVSGWTWMGQNGEWVGEPGRQLLGARLCAGPQQHGGGTQRCRK